MDEPRVWPHHPACEGACIFCLMRNAVLREFGGPGEILFDGIVEHAVSRAGLSPIARTDRVWDVHYGNYSPTEVDSVWATKELAEAEAARLNDSAHERGESRMWEVGYFIVRDSVLGAESTKEPK